MLIAHQRRVRKTTYQVLQLLPLTQLAQLWWGLILQATSPGESSINPKSLVRLSIFLKSLSQKPCAQETDINNSPLQF